MADTDEFWTAEEGSIYLRIPQSTTYKLAREKVFPASKRENTCGFAKRLFLNGWMPAKRKKSLPRSGNPT